MLLAVAVLVVGAPGISSAADDWIEVKSAHFTVISNASQGSTRKLAWQLEQVRSAMAALWSWARPDLNKPLCVIALKDENSMRALAPEYWEQKRAIRPASVWVTGPDQHYLVLRTDVEVEDRGMNNPYITAYNAYVSLVLMQSLDRPLPAWLSHGFTGVLSNTIVRDDHILIGPPIQWYLEILRQRTVQRLPELLAVTNRSPQVLQAEAREVFDAQTWSLVHFLMFGDQGAHEAKLVAYSKLVSAGADPTTAFAEAVGPLAAVETQHRNYVQRNAFSYRRFNIDVSVERERFPVRPLPPAESASIRAMFHAAMQRPVESRAAIADARKADPNAPGSFVAEALLLDRAGAVAEARAAYNKAAELAAPSAFVYYRLATLTWQPRPSPETLAEVEKLLTRAVGLNTRYAAGYAWLGEVRVALGNEAGIGLIRRAIVIEPSEPQHRLRAGRVSLRQGKLEDARRDAEAALALAETDDQRREAQQLLDATAKQKGDAPAGR